MYFQDMSRYQYYLPTEMEDVWAVGWLERGHPFPVGSICPKSIANLRELICGIASIKSGINPIRGQHPCNLCEEYIDVQCGEGSKVMLGSSEVWIPSRQGIFACPSLVLHYIEEHSYLPPEEFVATLENIDKSQSFDGQFEYDRRVEAIMKKS